MIFAAMPDLPHMAGKISSPDMPACSSDHRLLQVGAFFVRPAPIPSFGTVSPDDTLH
jgi:hypothetical protein